MGAVGLLFAHVGLALQARMEHKANFIIAQISNIIFYVCTTCALWIILERFGGMGGFEVEAVLLMYGLCLLTYFAAGVFLWGVSRDLEGLIRSGDLDHVLVKPLDPLLYLMMRGFEPSMLVKAAGALGICIYAMRALERPLGIVDAVWLASAVVGGTLIQGAIMLGCASIGFWAGRSRDVVELLIYSVRRFVEFPISIYPVAMQVALTVVVPYAFVNYYPVRGLLSGADDPVSLALAFSPLLVALPCSATGYMIWRMGLRRYEGAGG